MFKGAPQKVPTIKTEELKWYTDKTIAESEIPARIGGYVYRK
jgi:hypothetical protein